MFKIGTLRLVGYFARVRLVGLNQIKPSLGPFFADANLPSSAHSRRIIDIYSRSRRACYTCPRGGEQCSVRAHAFVCFGEGTFAGDTSPFTVPLISTFARATLLLIWKRVKIAANTIVVFI